MRASGLRLNALLGLALLGTGIAGYLTFVALDAGTEPFCTGVGDCAAVQSSQYAEVAGIPIALLGLGMYLGLLGLIGARRLWAGAPALFAPWAFALAFAGALYSAYLTYVEFFVIHAICAWCVASALVVTSIAALAAPDVRAGGEDGDDASGGLEGPPTGAGRSAKARL